MRLFRVYAAAVSIDQIAPEALRLLLRERALLAASLWESVEASLCDVLYGTEFFSQK